MPEADKMKKFKDLKDKYDELSEAEQFSIRVRLLLNHTSHPSIIILGYSMTQLFVMYIIDAISSINYVNDTTIIVLLYLLLIYNHSSIMPISFSYCFTQLICIYIYIYNYRNTCYSNVIL